MASHPARRPTPKTPHIFANPVRVGLIPTPSDIESAKDELSTRLRQIDREEAALQSELAKLLMERRALQAAFKKLVVFAAVPGIGDGSERGGKGTVEEDETRAEKERGEIEGGGRRVVEDTGNRTSNHTEIPTPGPKPSSQPAIEDTTESTSNHTQNSTPETESANQPHIPSLSPESLNQTTVPEHLQTIIPYQGAFAELRCPECGANAYSTLNNTAKYIAGVKGFASHRRSRHGIPFDLERVVSECVVRRIGAGELEKVVERGAGEGGMPFVLPPVMRKRRNGEEGLGRGVEERSDGMGREEGEGWAGGVIWDGNRRGQFYG